MYIISSSFCFRIWLSTSTWFVKVLVFSLKRRYMLISSSSVMDYFVSLTLVPFFWAFWIRFCRSVISLAIRSNLLHSLLKASTMRLSLVKMWQCARKPQSFLGWTWSAFNVGQVLGDEIDEPWDCRLFNFSLPLHVIDFLQLLQFVVPELEGDDVLLCFLTIRVNFETWNCSVKDSLGNSYSSDIGIKEKIIIKLCSASWLRF